MRIHETADSREAVQAAADILAREAAARPDLVLGLPTGRTMVPFYDELARRHQAAAHARHDPSSPAEVPTLDLSRARGFNLDEVLLPPSHPGTFHSYMERRAWGRTGLDRGRCDIPNPLADPVAECRRYDAALAAAGGLDLAFLGVGADGHVAYNLPGQVADGTHVVDLPPAVAATLDVPDEFLPLRAVTLGLGPLRTARRLVLLATTADKAKAVDRLLEGPSSDAWPCTLLRDHPRFDLLLTPAAMGSPVTA